MEENILALRSNNAALRHEALEHGEQIFAFFVGSRMNQKSPSSLRTSKLW